MKKLVLSALFVVLGVGFTSAQQTEKEKIASRPAPDMKAKAFVNPEAKPKAKQATVSKVKAETVQQNQTATKPKANPNAREARALPAATN